MELNPIYQALEQYRAGRLDSAADLCRGLLNHMPDDTATNHLLGVIYFKQGKTHAARELLAFASTCPDATPEIHNNLGAVLNALGDQEGALAAFKRATGYQSGFAAAHNNIAVIQRARGETKEAIDSLRRAVALNPDLAEAKTNLRNVYVDVVPPWHFAMMGDSPRNDAYEAAINRAVSGKRVLDIGTGSGLLAMMAARAGAASVTTCEAVPLIASRARDIVAANGLSGQIDVINKRSTDLALGAGIAERAQVLIAEVFSGDLIGEGILPTVEHAHQQLLSPDAVVVPAAASAMGYLIGGPVIEKLLFTRVSNGFDLSLFNDFAPPMLPVTLEAFPHEVLSADTELLRFDLNAKLFPMGNRPLNIMATQHGVCAGVAQWIRLELDSSTRYENRPQLGGNGSGHWPQLLYRFPRLIRVKPGDVLKVNIRHDRKQISVDLME